MTVKLFLTVLASLFVVMGCATSHPPLSVARLAESGDPEAQEHLGRLYERGEGFPKDLSEALKWYRKSADQGHSGAQNSLGVIYVNGDGVQQSYAEAAK